MIASYGEEWLTTNRSLVAPDYVLGLTRVKEIFGSIQAIERADKAAIMAGLGSLHAFGEQFRFVPAGTLNSVFWRVNNNDQERVKATLSYFIYGPGDFVERLHDTIFAPKYKLGKFGKFSALELYGTINPNECPPMNGRMAKALRFSVSA